MRKCQGGGTHTIALQKHRFVTRRRSKGVSLVGGGGYSLETILFPFMLKGMDTEGK